MKKGFTLIELLAVIVILAIIALIATPIVVNIIKSSQKSVALRSANAFIIAAQTAMVEGQLNNNISEDGNYAVATIDNKLYIKKSESKLYKINIKGSRPNDDGILTITKGKVTALSNFIINGYLITMNSNGDLTATKFVAKHYTTGQIVKFNPVSGSSCENGDECYDWIVVNQNSDNTVDIVRKEGLKIEIDFACVNDQIIYPDDYQDCASYNDSNFILKSGEIVYYNSQLDYSINKYESDDWSNKIKTNYTVKSTNEKYHDNDPLSENNIMVTEKYRNLTIREVLKLIGEDDTRIDQILNSSCFWLNGGDCSEITSLNTMYFSSNDLLDGRYDSIECELYPLPDSGYQQDIYHMRHFVLMETFSRGAISFGEYNRDGGSLSSEGFGTGDMAEDGVGNFIKPVIRIDKKLLD